MRHLKVTLVFLILFGTFCNAQDNAKIKNYKTFISAFKATDAALTYQSNKTKIEDVANKIKQSNLSAAQKDDLARQYTKIFSTSDSLYNGLISDLKSKQRRRSIVGAPTIYLDSLKGKMQNINNLCAQFETSYIEAISINKSSPTIVATILKEIIIPLANEFINEVVLPHLIQKYGDRYLKPYVVFESWK